VLKKRIYVFGTQFYAPDCAESIATTNYEVEYAFITKDNFTELNFIPKSGDMGEKFL
jgi:glutamine amidotransferase